MRKGDSKPAGVLGKALKERKPVWESGLGLDSDRTQYRLRAECPQTVRDGKALATDPF